VCHHASRGFCRAATRTRPRVTSTLHSTSRDAPHSARPAHDCTRHRRAPRARALLPAGTEQACPWLLCTRSRAHARAHMCVCTSCACHFHAHMCVHLMRRRAALRCGARRLACDELRPLLRAPAAARACCCASHSHHQHAAWAGAATPSLGHGTHAPLRPPAPPTPPTPPPAPPQPAPTPLHPLAAARPLASVSCTRRAPALRAQRSSSLHGELKSKYLRRCACARVCWCGCARMCWCACARVCWCGCARMWCAGISKAATRTHRDRHGTSTLPTPRAPTHTHTPHTPSHTHSHTTHSYTHIHSHLNSCVSSSGSLTTRFLA
jgi:hypothetical protein